MKKELMQSCELEISKSTSTMFKGPIDITIWNRAENNGYYVKLTIPQARKSIKELKRLISENDRDEDDGNPHNASHEFGGAV